MKMKYFFTALLAALSTVFVSCSDDNTITTMAEFQLSTSYVSLPMDSSSVSVDVVATQAWKVTAKPTWLTVDSIGNAGPSKMTFTAGKTLDGRNGEVVVTLEGGKTHRINVIQGLATISEATVAEVMAGPDSKTYMVKGTVTKITETVKYGNFYLNDGTSLTDLYIYGTKYQGKTQQAALEKLGVEVGDEIIVSGPKTTYNGTVELVDVDVVKLNKSLIKVESLSVEGELPIEGCDFTVFLMNKGQGVYVEVPEDAKSWLSITSVQGNSIVFKAAANDGGDRSTTVVFKTTDGEKVYGAECVITQKGAVAQVTCSEFNSKEDGPAQFKVRGIITKIASTKYGNLYINDGTGEVYTYGITDWNADDFKVGDEVVLQSVKTSHNGAPQMKNAVCLEKVAHDVKTVAELNELPDDKNTFFLVTGTVFHLQGDAYKFDLEQYGNFGLKDETGEIYVYGVADGLNGKTKNFAATGVKEGDNITILAYKTSYKGNNQIVGQFIKNNSAE